jgi:PhnB protein
MTSLSKIFFAPQLCIPSGVSDIGFYEKAFGAIEQQRWSNDDGTVHVAEFSIGEVLFHVHEEKISAGHLSPGKAKGITTLIGLFVDDVDAFFNKAIEAGAVAIIPPTTFDYNYQQAEVRDPFGHIWLLEKKV